MANKFNYKGFVKQTNTLHANLTDSQEKKRKENGGDDSPASGGSSPASHSPSTSSSTVDTRHTPAPSQIKAAAPHTRSISPPPIFFLMSLCVHPPRRRFRSLPPPR